MTTHFLPQTVMEGRLGEAGGAVLVAPSVTSRLAWLDSEEPKAVLEALTQPRAAQSAKGYFMPPAESVGRYGPGRSAAAAVAAPPTVLVGVRACELKARTYLDKVMLEGPFEDPLYRRHRENSTVISCDCADCTETCCCTLVGGRPFPTEGFDVNLSPADGGWLAEVGTDKGRAWLGEASGLAEATAAQLAARDAARKAMVDRLVKQNAAFTFKCDGLTGPRLQDDGDAAWQGHAADCVECGACTHICPTCYCFYLYDQALGPEEFERLRTWDSCLLSTYHRMAGGVNMKLSPRPRLSSRLANRVLHKFNYSPQQQGMVSCVGCGRCIDACPGAIDIRKVVQELGQ